MPAQGLQVDNFQKSFWVDVFDVLRATRQEYKHNLLVIS